MISRCFSYISLATMGEIWLIFGHKSRDSNPRASAYITLLFISLNITVSYLYTSVSLRSLGKGKELLQSFVIYPYLWQIYPHLHDVWPENSAA